MGFVILGVNLLFGLEGLDIGSRELIDTDGHMRYNRVMELVTGLNGWWDGWAHRANAPFGHSMHWTRPLDALLIALASPVAAVFGWADGLYFASLIVGPLFHLGLGVAVAWASRPVVGVLGSYLAGMGVAAQISVLSYAAPGRPDHHILIVVLALILIGSVIRLSLDESPRWVMVGGLSSAAGLWVSTEFLVALAVVLVFLGWRAMVGRNDLARFGLWFAAGVVVALLIERPPNEYFATEYDRLSIVHLVLAGLIGLVGLAVRGSSASKRAATIAVGGLLSAAVLRVLFPLFFGGPFADVPASVVDIWLVRVAELAPLWEAASHRASDLSLLVGTGVIGLLIGLVRLRRREQSAEWTFLLAALAVFLLFCVRSIRFAVYPAALGSIPIAAWAVDRLAVNEGRSVLKSLRRVFVMSVVVVGMAYPFLVARALEGPPLDGTSGQCDIKDVVAPLSAALDSKRGSVVLASLDSGPELIYRLPVRVVADPYHRNVEGILDSFAVFGSPDSRALLDKHEVKFVLVCENDADRGIYNSGGLYDQLLANNPPAGFRRVELDPESPLRLYERMPG